MKSLKRDRLISLFAYALYSGVTAADDLDIYLNASVTVPANILFLLDESGSMAFGETDVAVDDDNPNQRLFQLKKAMTNMMNDNALSDANIAIMGFRGTPPVNCSEVSSGTCLYPKITIRTKFLKLNSNRDKLNYAISKLKHEDSTPTTSALHDAVKWYKEGIRARKNDDSLVDFETPVTQWCQPNNIILLSDGAPNTNSIEHSGWGYYVNDLNNNAECEWTDKTRGQGFSASGTPQDGRCSPDIAEYAFTTDLNARLKEKQNITTHTIGFHTTDLADTFLEYIALKGGGEFRKANNAEELTSILSGVFKQASSAVNLAISAPSIPFNPTNSTLSGNDLYLPLFKPEVKPFWRGNLKKYRITVNSSGHPELVDANNSVALNASNKFISTSQSLWSTSVDGSDPLAGGSAEKRTGVRHLYTHLHGAGHSNQLIDHRLFEFNSIHPDEGGTANRQIPPARLGASNRAEADALLRWISTGHGYMGAPLHTTPHLLTYEANDIATELLLLPTSEGVLSAIDAQTGIELWGFIPDELLANIATIKEQISNPDNNDSSNDRIYGLDGHLEIIHNDSNNNGIVNTGESVLAIIGMRRGGRNYYALDLSDPLNPLFKWEVLGGSGNFTKLGQTWARPKFGKMQIGISKYDVMLFSGGYDPQQDNRGERRSPDEIGNAVYIVDANTGRRLWWASSKDSDLNIRQMTNSIPADALPVDVDNDGYWDRIYLADTGGRILRIDFYHKNGSQQTNGYLLADLNNTINSGNRRFFNPPTVGYFSKGGESFHALLIGSGNRPDPLNHEVQNRLYMIKDYNVNTPQDSGSYREEPVTITESHSHCTDSSTDCHILYDASDNLIQSGTQSEQEIANSAQSNSRGWYINLAPGEMTTSKALLYNHTAYFSTFTGSVETTTDSCDSNETRLNNSLYAVDMRVASAVFSHLDGVENELTTSDRSTELNIDAIAPGISLFFSGDSSSSQSETDSVINKLFIGSGVEMPISINYTPIPLWWEEVISVE